MPISTFLNGRAPVRLRGALFLALTDSGNVSTSVSTSDLGGGVTQVWSSGASVPCRIAPIGGVGQDEEVVAARMSDRSTHIVTVPIGTAISTSSRFVIAGRGAYEVTGVREQTSELAKFFEVVKAS